MLKTFMFLYVACFINEVHGLASRNLPTIERNAFEVSYIDLKFLIYFLHFLFISNQENSGLLFLWSLTPLYSLVSVWDWIQLPEYWYRSWLWFLGILIFFPYFFYLKLYCCCLIHLSHERKEHASSLIGSKGHTLVQFTVHPGE